jgi:mannose-6-phosphate isomerase-like protein (cupin superfamily)
MTYRAGEEIFHLGVGDFIDLPLGVPHAFRITGDAPAKSLELTVPGRLLGRWNEFGPQYGLQVVGPPIPEDA